MKVKKIIGLLGIIVLLQNCSPKLKVNALNDVTYIKSLKEIREGIDKDEISDFEMDITLILFGDYFLDPDPDFPLAFLAGSPSIVEEELIKKLNNLTYEAIKKKSEEIQKAYYQLHNDKVDAYHNREKVFSTIHFDKIEYFKRPHGSQEDWFYPYVDFEVTNRANFNISAMTVKANITNEHQPFYEVKFNYKFKDVLLKDETRKVKIHLNEYAHLNGFEDLSSVNTYLEGEVILVLEEVRAKNGVIQASATLPDEVADIKDVLSLVWFGLSMTHSHLLGAEKKTKDN